MFRKIDVEVKSEVSEPRSTPKNVTGVEQGSLKKLFSCGVENALGEVIGNLSLVAGYF
jgi:hypothetical protein